MIGVSIATFPQRRQSSLYDHLRGREALSCDGAGVSWIYSCSPRVDSISDAASVGTVTAVHNVGRNSTHET